MAINIDTVYQRVLSILNKEQRGYITPQKFNLYANQVQLEILDSYFYDLEYFLNFPGNSTVHADMVDLLQTKIAKFEDTDDLTYVAPNFILPANCYRISTVLYNDIECQQVDRKRFRYIMQSEIAKPTSTTPIYTENKAGIRISAATVLTNLDLGDLEVDFIKQPAKVEWGYTVILNEAVYNAGQSTNFELDPSEEPLVVTKILKLAGVEVKDLTVYEIANTGEMTEKQIEKQ